MPAGWSDQTAHFEARQAEVAEAVERRLAEWLADAASTEAPARLAEAMRYATLGGGKRFRAFLVAESAGLFQVSPDAALDVAAALECMHAYSLVHDDLPAMDNDPLRRGKPTVWKAFDEWTAILAGDGLLTLAFEILGQARGVPSETRVQLVLRLAQDAGRAGMVGGQMLDLEAEKLGRPAQPTLAHVSRLQAMKTGALIVFACDAGAILGNASASERAAMTRYGRALGQAFQISDDLLDAQGDAAIVGKAVGKDAGLGKATLGTLMGMPAAKARLAEVVTEAVDALSGFGDLADALRQAAQFMATRQK